MNVNDLFKKPARPKPSGLSQAEADEAVQREFSRLMEPVADKATQFFRGFTSPNGGNRTWLLPMVELWSDVPIEKQKYVLRYRSWFLSEINRVVIDDDVPYEFK